MRLPIYQIDAFTDRVFGGNPAAVVLLDAWLDDAVLQSVAAENNLSETAFVTMSEGVSGLRWFTPAVEVDLCGHATLAAAYVLFQYYVPDRTEVRFETRAGELSVVRSGDVYTLDFPSRPGKPVEVDRAMAEALGVRPEEAYAARDLLLVLGSEEDVRAISPDYRRIAELDTFAVIVTAPGSNADFVSRFFAPGAGVPEDPVTGSAHCTLIPYWADRLGRTRLTAEQLSPRGGRLLCELRGGRVGIGGRAAEYMKGEIQVPEIPT